MRFQVPQFIGVEDKVIGPLTVKQFIYLAGGGGILFVLYQFLPLLVAIIFMLPVAALAVALAFYKWNNKPFIAMLENMVRFVFGSKLYIWEKVKKKTTKKEGKGDAPKSTLYVPKLVDSKLKDLTWSLDVNESLNPVTRNEERGVQLH